MSVPDITPAPGKTWIFLASGLAMFAIAPIIVRLAGPGSDPVAITTVRTVSAFLMLLPFWLYKRMKKSEPSMVWSRREVGWSALAGLMLSIHFTLWIGSLFFTSVASASVLVTIHPIMLIIVESAVLKKKFPAWSWIGVSIAFSGSVMLGIFDSTPGETYSNPVLGNIMAFSAAIFFVFYILISQKIRKSAGWLDYVFTVYGFTALGSLVIALFTGVSLNQPLSVILSGVGLAIGAQIIGHGSMNYAVKFVSATLLSTLILAEPVFATILAVIFFNEVPVLGAMAAMAIVMTGIFLTWWGRRGAKKAASKD